MPVTPRHLILWNLDRTLLDTGPAARRWYDEAFLKVAETPLTAWPDLPGGTDLALAGELFRVHGCGRPDPAFFDEVARLAHEDLRRLRKRGRILPGAREALGALARRGDVAQSTVTANLRALAEVKLAAFGLAPYLDPDIGAFGMESTARGDLVAAAVRRTDAKYRPLPGRRVVLVGDAAEDMQAAREQEAVAVGVTTGLCGAQELRAAGARHVLGSLADTGAVLRAVLGD